MWCMTTTIITAIIILGIKKRKQHYALACDTRQWLQNDDDICLTCPPFKDAVRLKWNHRCQKYLKTFRDAESRAQGGKVPCQEHKVHKWNVTAEIQIHSFCIICTLSHVILHLQYKNDLDIHLYTIIYTIGEGNGTPLQYSCLENPMGGGAWWAAIRGVAKSRTWLSNFTFTFHFHALEKEMATHSSVLAWRIPGTGKPGGLPSMGLHRVGHDWSDLAAYI